ncbi:MAG TPA: PEP-CTERM sorting domain-containing protein [Janthinobacterium sp.]|nr:PEP-CTERM sorting domain-containing protein [Janthinobacterium sp.]
MKFSSILTFAALATAAFGASAATPTFSAGGTVVNGAGIMSSVAGATTITFDANALPGNYTGGMVFASGHPGYAALPPHDQTPFYSVGITNGQTDPGTATFAGGLKYFGFYMGSADTYNSVIFYSADHSNYTLTGNAMAALGGVSPNGNQSQGFYVNAWASGSAFTKIEFHSPRNAFETDNHAYLSAVPETESYAMLLAGLGLLAFMRRRQS